MFLEKRHFLFYLFTKPPSKTLWYNWLVPQFFIIIKMRGKELSPQQRDQIIGAHLSGAKGRVIAEKLDIPIQTIYDTIKRFKETGTPHPTPRPGRPKSLSTRTKQLLHRETIHHCFTSLGNITVEVNFQLNTTFHTNTIRKYIYESWLASCIARKKLLLTERHRLARLT